MSLPLVIYGTPDEVEVVLLRIRDIIDNRKTNGWPLFQKGEKWLYNTRPDLGHVCPVCRPHDGTVFDGEEVPRSFPYKEMAPPYGEYPAAFPRTHMPDLSKFADTPCHCEMVLQNPAEVMEMRLHEEKLAVI